MLRTLETHSLRSLEGAEVASAYKGELGHEERWTDTIGWAILCVMKDCNALLSHEWIVIVFIMSLRTSPASTITIIRVASAPDAKY